ncbi:MAG: CHAT domain-containing protein [Bacteroidota bacterium]
MILSIQAVFQIHAGSTNRPLLRTSLICLLSLLILTQKGFAESTDGCESKRQGITFISDNNIPDAIQSFQQAISAFSEEDNQFEALNCYYYLAYCLARSNKREEILAYESSLQQMLHHEFDIGWQIRAALALAHLEKANLTLANYYYEQIIQHANLDENFLAISEAYLGKGKLLFTQGEYVRANALYDEFLRLCEAKIPKSPNIHYLTARAHLQIGLLSLEQNKHSEAVSYFKKNLTLIDNIPANRKKSTLSQSFNNIGSAFLGLKQPDSALFYLHKKLKIESKKSLRTGNTFKFIGLAYAQQQEYDKALDTLFLCKAAREERYPYKCNLHPEILNPIGEVHQSLGKWQEALSYHQQALIQLIDTFEQADPSVHPPLAGIQYKSLFLETLLHKIQAAHGLYSQTGRQEDLELGFQTVLLADKWIDSLRTSYHMEGSKLFLAKRARDIYALGMDMGYQLLTETQDSSYLDRLFYLSEKNKGLLLVEAFQNAKAEGLQSIPADSLAKETELSRKITYLETKLHTAISSNKSSAVKTKIKQQVFQTRQQLIRLQEYFSATYPHYHSVRFQTAVQTLPQLQQSLNPEQALIEYFLTKAHIYAFYVSPQSQELFKIEREIGLKTAIEDFRKGIFDYHTKSREDEQKTDSLRLLTKHLYRHQGHRLFELLIGQIRKKQQLPRRLIIVPDGVLGYVPFDALLSEPVQASTKYDRYPYLMNDHLISYSYSATLLREMRERENRPSKKQILAMGLSFKEGGVRGSLRNAEILRGGRHFPMILNATSEVEGLKDRFPNTSKYLNGEATKTHFVQLANAYQVLHFSTHGILDSASEFSFLALANSAPHHTEGRLYVRDLYNQRLQADMVFLSACETGLGKLYEGEGIISLARGFSYAGAKSIITTLWSISDRHSTWLVLRFYEYLDQGYEKDEALWLARKDFMVSEHFLNNEDRHPFYWAAFTPIGDMSPVELGNPLRQSLFWIAGLSLLLFGLWFWRSQRMIPQSTDTHS